VWRRCRESAGGGDGCVFGGVPWPAGCRSGPAWPRSTRGGRGRAYSRAGWPAAGLEVGLSIAVEAADAGLLEVGAQQVGAPGDLVVHGALGDVEGGGDLADGLALEFAEGHDRAAAGGQFQEGGGEQFDLLLVAELFGGVGRLYHDGQVGQIPQTVGRGRAPVAQVVDREVPGDAEEEGLGRAHGLFEVPAPDAQVGFLHEVLDVAHLGKLPPQPAAQLPVVGVDLVAEPLPGVVRGGVGIRVWVAHFRRGNAGRPWQGLGDRGGRGRTHDRMGERLDLEGGKNKSGSLNGQRDPNLPNGWDRQIPQTFLTTDYTDNTDRDRTEGTLIFANWR